MLAGGSLVLGVVPVLVEMPCCLPPRLRSSPLLCVRQSQAGSSVLLRTCFDRKRTQLQPNQTNIGTLHLQLLLSFKKKLRHNISSKLLLNEKLLR